MTAFWPMPGDFTIIKATRLILVAHGLISTRWIARVAAHWRGLCRLPLFDEDADHTVILDDEIGTPGPCREKLPIFPDTAVADFIVENNRVVGVLIEQKGQRARVLANDGVLVNAGGFHVIKPCATNISRVASPTPNGPMPIRATPARYCNP